MKDYLKVEGHDNLYRDPNTGAIINIASPPKKTLTTQFASVIDDINTLKAEISEIKTLLKEIVANGSS